MNGRRYTRDKDVHWGIGWILHTQQLAYNGLGRR